MRGTSLAGLGLLVIGLVLLYLLRSTFVTLVVFLLKFLGVVLALILIIAGLAMIFFRSRTYRLTF